MKDEDGWVTLLPEQICCLADFAQHALGAVSIKQKGSIIFLSDGDSEVYVDAMGRYLPPPNQENPPC